MRVLLRGQTWVVRREISLGVSKLLRLENALSGECLEALCPPDEFEPLVEPAPRLDRRSLTPFGIWRSLHDALQFQSPPEGRYAAFHAGRISPEPYQFAPLARLLAGPRRSLLITDDVGLGKTVEAGICLLELIARGVGKRILLVVPPGLIPQWLGGVGHACEPVLDCANPAWPEAARSLPRSDPADRHATQRLPTQLPIAA